MSEEDLDKLKQAVIDGHGEMICRENSGNKIVQEYITHSLPLMMDRISAIHNAVSRDDLTELRTQLDNEELVPAKDNFGMTSLHKAVILGHTKIVKFLTDNFPEIINITDKDGRTALHYATAASRKESINIYKILIQAGADPKIRDMQGRTADYYRTHRMPTTLKSPLKPKTSPNLIQNQSEYPTRPTKQGGKYKNRFQGRTADYYRTHRMPTTLKSPLKPKTSPNLIQNQSEYPTRPTKQGVMEKITSTLQKGDIEMLKEIVLEGYGKHLLGRTSWNEDVRQYLKTLPQYLATIRSLQEAVIAGDINTIEKRIKDDEKLLKSKDESGLTPIHLAIIHNKPEIVNYLTAKYPIVLNLKDINGRTPLHLAAQENRTELYRLMKDNGADPMILDQKGRSAEYYLSEKEDEKSPRTPILSENNKLVTNEESTTEINTNDAKENNLSEETVLVSNTDISTSGQNDATEKENNSDSKEMPKPKTIEETKTESVNENETNETSVEENNLQITEQDNKNIEDNQKKEKNILNIEPEEKINNSDKVATDDKKSENVVTTDCSEPKLQQDENQNTNSIPEEVPNSHNNQENAGIEKQDEKNEEESNPQEDGKDEEESNPREDGKDEEVSHRKMKKMKKSNPREDGKDEEVSNPQEDGKDEEESNTQENEKNEEENTPQEDVKNEDSIPQEDVKNEESNPQEDEKENILHNEKNEERTPQKDEKNEISEDEMNSTNNPEKKTESDQEESKFIHAENTNTENKKEELEITRSDDLGTNSKINETVTLNSAEETADSVNRTEDNNNIPENIESTEQNTVENSNVNKQIESKPDDKNNTENHENCTNEIDKEREEIDDDKTENNVNPEVTKSEENNNENDQTEDFSENIEQEGDKSKEIQPNTGNVEKQETNAEINDLKENDKNSINDQESIKMNNDDSIIENEKQTNSSENDDIKIDNSNNAVLTKQVSNDEAGDQNDSEEKLDINNTNNELTNINLETVPVEENDKSNTINESLNLESNEEFKNDKEEIINNSNSNVKASVENLKSKVESRNHVDVESNQNNSQTANTNYSYENKNSSSSRIKTNSGIKNRNTGSRNSSQKDYLDDLIEQWIKEGDLLRLEHVVLAGQGDRLIEKTSDDKQVQDFLDLVPIYTAKIRAIHEAVIRGNLREVRAVLTRKRFALSRDHVGASPLHLAVLHRHADIVQYIISHFPETMDGPDNEGRTPLHYAAVIPDEGYLYKIIKAQGADENIKDKMGMTPKYYLENGGQLTVQDLWDSYKSGEEQ
ncbi:GATA zinc finger domain-containing protein 14-like [Centruroides sculpturatus]|uniref:GATA zinc finger domain-containing protein 14-like n=1 Tax=Centruroides sculpturatus TaxID=218467 RepID=UPI000C6CB155|nr:GATA zinc finger domain-containing protein 14-like [Centruroides sculpturatus]